MSSHVGTRGMQGSLRSRSPAFPAENMRMLGMVVITRLLGD